MRTSLEVGEPEVWFRIVHLAQDTQSGARMVSYREQMVEIALGPKGAFDNDNIGALKLRAPPSRVVSAVPPGRCDPKPPRESKTPRVVELLRKTIKWKALLGSGQIATQTDIARQEGITRARVTQVMGLLRLAPEIQEYILSMPVTVPRPSVSERALRIIEPITDCRDQLREFFKFLVYAFGGGTGRTENCTEVAVWMRYRYSSLQSGSSVRPVDDFPASSSSPMRISPQEVRERGVAASNRRTIRTNAAADRVGETTWKEGAQT